MRLLVVAITLCLASCLTAPEPTGRPSTKANNDPQNNVTDGGGQDMADAGPRPDTEGDPELDCASCTEGATRCDAANWQECVNFEGCHIWVTAQTCEGEQACDPDNGCSCPPDSCVPGEIPDCSATGVMDCVVIDGCPKLVDVGRDSTCGPPGPPAGGPSCDDAPEKSYCRECTADRGCYQRCQNASGWTCGLP